MDLPPIPPDQFPPLFMQIGEFVVNWGLLDWTVTKFVAAIYHGAGGKHHAPSMPFEFGRRVKFIRRCLSQIPALAPYAPTMRAVLTSAKELTTIRDLIVHGAISGYEKETGLFVFVKLDLLRGDDMHEANTSKISLPVIQAAVVTCQDAMRAATISLYDLMDTIVR